MRWLAFLPLVGLLGCNQYEMFRVAGFEQSSFNNDADILFVVDNSDSMQPVASDLALNFDGFINKLTSEEGSNVPRETLGDAVRNYLRETGGGSLYIDYQLAITTTSVIYNAGAGQTDGVDPGEAGTLAGDPPVIPRTDPNVAIEFQRNLLCQATCWDYNDVPAATEPFDCTDDPVLEGEVTREYLDCLCGVGEWDGNCGSGQEMGLEGAALALCRAVESPPDACYEYEDPQGDAMKSTAFTDADIGSNDGLLREGANTLVVIISDDGDQSYRMATGDADIGLYLDLFAEFPNPVRLAVVGPNYDRETGDFGCNSAGAQVWSTNRYQNLVGELNGLYVPIEDEDESGNCDYTDFGANLEQIGDLLSNLLSLFPLQAVPDVSTIEVWVDDVQIAPAEIVEGSLETRDAVYGDGWSYEASENAIAFHGAAIPAYNADVRIYYRPIGGTPRDLPPGF